MKRYKPTKYIYIICIFFSIIACSDNDETLIGHWEMPVEMDGVKFSYVIELNSTERTYEPFNDLNGRKSYGFMNFSNLRHIYQYDIDSIASLGNGLFVVKTVDSNNQMFDPSLTTSIDTLRINADNKQLVYKTYQSDWVFNYINPETVSTPEDSPEKNEPFGSTWKDKLLIVWALIFLVIIYYLAKILLGYVLSTLLAGAIGAAAGGLILWLLMGGFDLDLPRWLIITIMSVTTVPMALFGLWSAILSTKDLAKAPLASQLAKKIMKESKKGEYIVDEYGNKSKIRKMERGILGEKYIETEDGKHYEGGWGSNEVKENE
mgnify:CR=1 FL=1